MKDVPTFRLNYRCILEFFYETYIAEFLPSDSFKIGVFRGTLLKETRRTFQLIFHATARMLTLLK